MPRVRRLDGLPGLRRVLPGLAAVAAAQDDPFLAAGWLECWYAHFADAGEPCLLAVERDDGSLMALLPLLLTRATRRKLPVRVLRTAVLHSAGPLRSGVAVAPAEAAAAIDALVGFLAREFRGWDWLELEGLAADAGQAELFAAAAARQGWSPLPPETVETARVLVVDRPWEDYLRTRRRHFRRHLVDERHRLDRFRWSLALLRSADEWAAAVPAIEGILCRRYALASIGALPAADLRAWRFLIDVASRFAAAGKLDLRLLYVDDQPSAFVLSLLGGDVAYPFFTKYAPEAEAASPGRGVITALLRDAHACGYRRIDFLSDWSYIGRFTDATRDFVRLTFFPAGWYGRLLHTERRLSERRAGPLETTP